MQTFSQYTAWENFLASEVGRLESEETGYEDAYDVALALGIEQCSAQAKNATEAKLLAKGTQDVQLAKLHLEKARAMRKAYTIQRDSVARASNLISRELSRRIGRDSIERRAQRWSP